MQVELMIYTKGNMCCCEILLKIAIFLAISFFYYFLYKAAYPMITITI